MGAGGEIFLLEMGEPVKIVDMAHDLIRFSGFEPEKDIKIEFIGLRPGEKLFEELITDGEGIIKTDHKKILILKNGFPCEKENASSTVMDNESSHFLNIVNELILLEKKCDPINIKTKLATILPEYTISDEWKFTVLTLNNALLYFQ